MRKRLLIGALAALAMGIVVGAYVAADFLSQPKKGTVDYHKRKYAEAGVPEWVLWKGVPRKLRDYYERRFHREFEFHRSALIDAGYLRESVFVVSNASAVDVLQAVQIELPKDVNELTTMSYEMPGNVITVVAPSEWTDKLGRAIREADTTNATRVPND